VKNFQIAAFSVFCYDLVHEQQKY